MVYNPRLPMRRSNKVKNAILSLYENQRKKEFQQMFNVHENGILY